MNGDDNLTATTTTPADPASPNDGYAGQAAWGFNGHDNNHSRGCGECHKAATADEVNR